MSIGDKIYIADKKTLDSVKTKVNNMQYKILKDYITEPGDPVYPENKIAVADKKTLDEINSTLKNMPTFSFTGTAMENNVIKGKTFYSDNITKKTGTFNIDALKPENIKKGVSIGGVVGTLNAQKEYGGILISTYMPSKTVNVVPFLEGYSTDYPNAKFQIYGNRIYGGIYGTGDPIVDRPSRGVLLEGNIENGITQEFKPSDGKIQLSAISVYAVVNEALGRIYVPREERAGYINMTTFSIDSHDTINDVRIGSRNTPTINMICKGSNAALFLAQHNYMLLTKDGGNTYKTVSLPFETAWARSAIFPNSSNFGLVALPDKIFKTTDCENYQELTLDSPFYSGLASNSVLKLKYFGNNIFGVTHIESGGTIEFKVFNENGHVLESMRLPISVSAQSMNKYVRYRKFEGFYSKNNIAYIMDKTEGRLYKRSSASNRPDDLEVAFSFGISCLDYEYIRSEHKLILFGMGTQFSLQLPNNI